jgi:hypothetical protein
VDKASVRADHRIRLALGDIVDVAGLAGHMVLAVDARVRVVRRSLRVGLVEGRENGHRIGRVVVVVLGHIRRHVAGLGCCNRNRPEEHRMVPVAEE